MDLDLKPFSDEKELAELLGVRPNTLAKWRCCNAGPPFIKICGRIRYARDDVQSWLSQRRQACDLEVAR